MMTSLRAPMRFVQAAGIMDKIGSYAKETGNNILILISEGGIRRFGDRIRKSFLKNECAFQFEAFAGDATYKEIDRIADIAVKGSFDTIAGIGGGRILDTARAAADKTDRRLIIMPTTVSNDAPCSAVAVIHDDNGKAVEVRTVRRNPDFVLIDTEVVANAPAHFLSAGIGDALATFYEARANGRRQEKENNGEIITRTAIAMSKLCDEIIREYGVKAIESVKNKKVTYELEQVVHAASYLSGYGFENGGVAAAHATNEGFSVLPRCSKILHGDLVGFGVLIQLELEGAPEEEKKETRDFMRSVGLSVNLSELGLDDITEEELRAVSKAACEVPPMKNMPFEVKPEDVYKAIIAADKAGR